MSQLTFNPWKSWIFLNPTQLKPVVSQISSQIEIHFDIFIHVIYTNTNYKI